jgi:hypothetical protein
MYWSGGMGPSAILRWVLPIKPLKQTAHIKTQKQVTQTPRCKWAMFTYVGKETSYITNVFRQTDL